MLKNTRGLAMIEILPLLVVFILMVNFAYGFFGIIHSGILNSIASRNYAFETFRNRANVNYLRDISDSDRSIYYGHVGVRYHGTVKEHQRADKWIVTTRPLKFTDIGNSSSDAKGVAEHDKLKIIQEGKKASESGIEDGVSPVWVRVIYGICLNATCGDS